jgi:hypothetical protein
MREAYCKDIVVAMIDKAIADKNPNFDILLATELAIKVCKLIKIGVEDYSKEQS